MLMRSPVPGDLKSRMDFHLFDMMRSEMEMHDFLGTFLNFMSQRDREVHSLTKVKQKRIRQLF